MKLAAAVYKWSDSNKCQSKKYTENGVWKQEI